MKSIETLFTKVNKAKTKYEQEIEKLHHALEDKIEFEFGIEFQPSDGHMILDVESGLRIATVSSCLSIIKKKGKLSREDHNAICI